jgi:hypothetical protein
MRAMFTISLFFSCFCCNCTNSATSDSYVVFLNLLNSSSDKRLRKASRALVNASVGPGAVTETNVACWESAPVDDLLVFCVAGGVFMVGVAIGTTCEVYGLRDCNDQLCASRVNEYSFYISQEARARTCLKPWRTIKPGKRRQEKANGRSKAEAAGAWVVCASCRHSLH